ncbi:DUF4870 domain-containing protein [uncultured Polaribacter sp.]|uniref:DUF4870 domain-containing protein n=1 Tax=uncultured Polaribacter sp. TaxID=174711 RepID=UPI0026181151|nr:DUF4870 domain-containing protein [uncultured Polaribacter sp.]
MKQNNENTNAFLIHISSFLGFVFPFGGIISPLIAWQTLKDRSAFLDDQGKEAVNFNISYSLYIFIASASILPFLIGNIINNSHFNIINDHSVFSFFGIASIAGFLMILKIALIFIAAIKAKEGENYHYPFTIKFIK